MIRFKEKLQHPFALVLQGFVAGSIIFWATAPGKSMAHTADAPIATSSAPSR